MGFYSEALAAAQAKYLALMQGTSERVSIAGTEYTLTNSAQLLREIETLERKAAAEASGGGGGARRIYPTYGRP